MPLDPAAVRVRAVAALAGVEVHQVERALEGREAPGAAHGRILAALEFLGVDIYTLPRVDDRRRRADA